MSKRKFSYNGMFYPCLYCANLVLGDEKGLRFGEGGYYGCNLRRDEKGMYFLLRNIIVEGSKDFIPSGLPAHPDVLKDLIKINSRCSTIPSDPRATETDYDFDRKIRKFLQPENVDVDIKNFR